MKLSEIKSALNAHGAYEWQLCLQLGINKATFNSWSHVDFKGHEDSVKNGLRKLLNKGGQYHDAK